MPPISCYKVKFPDETIEVTSRFLLAEGSKLQLGVESVAVPGSEPSIIVNGAVWELGKTGGSLVVDADVANVRILDDGMMRTAGMAITFRTFS